MIAKVLFGTTMETSHSPAECTTLLRWRTRKGSEGSNPSVSALFSPVRTRNNSSSV